jgi:hypothetical protein
MRPGGPHQSKVYITLHLVGPYPKVPVGNHGEDVAKLKFIPCFPGKVQFWDSFFLLVTGDISYPISAMLSCFVLGSYLANLGLLNKGQSVFLDDI